MNCVLRRHATQVMKAQDIFVFREKFKIYNTTRLWHYVNRLTKWVLWNVWQLAPDSPEHSCIIIRIYTVCCLLEIWWTFHFIKDEPRKPVWTDSQSDMCLHWPPVPVSQTVFICCSTRGGINICGWKTNYDNKTVVPCNIVALRYM